MIQAVLSLLFIQLLKYVLQALADIDEATSLHALSVHAVPVPFYLHVVSAP